MTTNKIMTNNDYHDEIMREIAKNIKRVDFMRIPKNKRNEAIHEMINEFSEIFLKINTNSNGWIKFTITANKEIEDYVISKLKSFNIEIDEISVDKKSVSCCANYPRSEIIEDLEVFKPFLKSVNFEYK